MAIKRYLDNANIKTQFDDVKNSLPHGDVEWLEALRSAAMDSFLETGIPGPKVEEWKYTNLGFLANENFANASQVNNKADIKHHFDQAYFPHMKGPVIVFVNGYLAKEMSDYTSIEGVEITTLTENPDVLKEAQVTPHDAASLSNLNLAMATDGYRLTIEEGVSLEQPVQIIHIATLGTDGHTMRYRGEIKADKSSKIKIIETFIGPNDERYWSQMVNTVQLAENSEISICQFQLQGNKAVHMTELYSDVAKTAKFSHLSLHLGAEINRTELINTHAGENSDIELRGAYLGREKQSHDIFTRINHDVPHCQSNQVFRGVLDEGGRSAFQGKVVVARDAQKTNADQSNKNLLLNRKAEANAKPELLIYADDVKCTHGATVGELDPDQLFYLRSRGMNEAAAKGLLVEAFVAEIFDDLEDDNLRDKFKEKAAGWLNQKVTS